MSSYEVLWFHVINKHTLKDLLDKYEITEIQGRKDSALGSICVTVVSRNLK